MTVGKILLYYKFTPIADPKAVMLWQRELCELLGLKGRILISEHGINGTVGGDIDACKAYIKRFRKGLELEREAVRLFAKTEE